MSEDNWHSRHRAVYRFGEHWEKMGKFRWFHENIAIFDAEIVYEAKNKTRTVITKCHLTHEGKIELLESNWLNHTDHYLGFNIDWQKVSLTEDYELRIEGNGAKLPGSYVVLIRPT